MALQGTCNDGPSMESWETSSLLVESGHTSNSTVSWDTCSLIAECGHPGGLNTCLWETSSLIAEHGDWGSAEEKPAPDDEVGWASSSSQVDSAGDMHLDLDACDTCSLIAERGGETVETLDSGYRTRTAGSASRLFVRRLSNALCDLKSLRVRPDWRLDVPAAPMPFSKRNSEARVVPDATSRSSSDAASPSPPRSRGSRTRSPSPLDIMQESVPKSLHALCHVISECQHLAPPQPADNGPAGDLTQRWCVKRSPDPLQNLKKNTIWKASPPQWHSVLGPRH